MGYKSWHLAAMEEHGHTTTNAGLINRVAYCRTHNAAGNIGSAGMFGYSLESPCYN